MLRSISTSMGIRTLGLGEPWSAFAFPMRRIWAECYDAFDQYLASASAILRTSFAMFLDSPHSSASTS